MSPEQTIEEINRRIEDETRPSLVYLYSSACRACNPAVAQTMRELTRLDTLAVDVDAVPDIWTAFGLGSVPTWLLVGQGVAIAEWPGVLEVASVAARVVDTVRQAGLRGSIE